MTRVFFEVIFGRGTNANARFRVGGNLRVAGIGDECSGKFVFHLLEKLEKFFFSVNFTHDFLHALIQPFLVFVSPFSFLGFQKSSNGSVRGLCTCFSGSHFEVFSNHDDLRVHDKNSHDASLKGLPSPGEKNVTYWSGR